MLVFKIGHLVGFYRKKKGRKNVKVVLEKAENQIVFFDVKLTIVLQ